MPPLRPVTSQVAAEIGYDPAGGTDPGPFTQQVAERLHAADPRWGRRINSTGPISDDTVAYRVGTSPVNPLQHRYRTRRPYHARLQWHTYDHWAETPGRIPLYPGISRYIPVYLGSFFLFAGTKAAARPQRSSAERHTAAPTASVPHPKTFGRAHRACGSDLRPPVGQRLTGDRIPLYPGISRILFLFAGRVSGACAARTEKPRLGPVPTGGRVSADKSLGMRD